MFRNLGKFSFVLLVLAVLIGMSKAPKKDHSETQKPIAIDTTLNADELKLKSWVTGQTEQMAKDLETIVNISSGSQNIEGLKQMGRYFANELKALGFSHEFYPGGSVPRFSCAGGEVKFADHLVARRNGSNGPRILLSGHLDTVFPKGHKFNRFSRQGDIVKGPGVLDMKGGLIVMLYALKNLKKHGYLDETNISIVLNSDEEMGSLGSRGLLVDLSKQHDFGLVFEGSYKNRLVRSRKGLGQVRLLVKGRASHAGAAHKQGVSAIKELAKKVVSIEDLTDYNKKTTVNVGVIKGGEARNTVPPCAEAYIDLRYPEQDQGETLIERIKKITSKSETKNKNVEAEAKTSFWGVLHRPAKEPSKKTDQMLSQIMGISKVLGVELDTTYSGGGTDGSIMQSVGLPTVDSLGMSGSGAHSPREQAELSSLEHRTQLASIYLLRLIRTKGLQ